MKKINILSACLMVVAVGLGALVGILYSDSSINARYVDALSNYYSERFAEKDGSIANLQKDLSDSGAEKATLRSQINAVLSERKEIAENLEILEKNTASEINTLQTKISNVSDEISAKNKTIDTLNAALVREMGISSRLGTDYDGTVNQLVNLGQDIQGLNRQLKVLEASKPTRRQPTLDELRAWLSIDDTNDTKYSPDYSCTDFATQLNNRTVKYYDVGFVFLSWEFKPDGNKKGHTMNAFKLDTGEIVFVEPQNDQILKLKVGDKYAGHVVKQILIAW